MDGSTSKYEVRSIIPTDDSGDNCIIQHVSENFDFCMAELDSLTEYGMSLIVLVDNSVAIVPSGMG